MGKSFFIWNDIDCRSMGVSLAGPVPIVRPEERVKHVEIPGRSGDLTQTEGDDIYNSYIQTATIQVKGGYRVRDIYKWLRGASYVTFSGEPDRKQPARIIGAITLDKVSHNLDIWTGEVQFYCQPLKEKLYSETVEITSSGSTVVNSGDVISKPLFRVTASSSSIMISTGKDTIIVTGLTSGSKYIIDSDSMEVLSNDGTTLLTKNATGTFPVLLPGENTITGSGWSKIVITRRERFL